MTLKALRTRSALKLAPWLQEPQEYVREWKISSTSLSYESSAPDPRWVKVEAPRVPSLSSELPGLRNVVRSSRAPFKDLSETKRFTPCFQEDGWQT